MPRRKPQQTNTQPLINFRKPVYESVSFTLSQAVIERLKDYARYIQSVTDERPTTDEVVEKGMQWLFDSDKGFQTWLEKSGSEPVRRSAAEPHEQGQNLSAAAAAGEGSTNQPT